MALVDLLQAAGRVELDHLDVERVVEVGDRRVVERQMPVLTDAEAAQVEWVPAQEPRVAVALGFGVARAPRRSTPRWGGPVPRCARGSSAGSPPGGLGRRRRTRPCGRPRCRAQGTPAVSSTSACTKASWEFPVANITWATPRASTAARMTSTRLVGGGPRHAPGRPRGRGPWRRPRPVVPGPHEDQHARCAWARLGRCASVEIPGPAHMEAAWKAVRRYLAVTPAVGAPQLGPSVSVKVETVQPTGSFKVRGGLAAVSATLDEEHRAAPSSPRPRATTGWASPTRPRSSEPR